MKRLYSLLFLCCSWTVLGQSGDKAGEVQNAPELPVPIPDAPVLSPMKAIEAMRVPPGLRVELVASEPMVEAPVEIEFAPDGRMYVLEMRGFMRSVDGAGEDEPLGRISLLEDSDGDGRMDKSTVFAEGLTMPRAIAVVRNGLLVAEPPHLWFLRDEDGDGKADKKEEVSNDYGNQKNPEHTANGLLWGRDNWIYSANHTVRYQNVRGYWEKEATQFRGQWGLSQDDYGRLFFNSNSDQLRADLLPGSYFLRNKNLKSPFGLNVQVAKDQSTFPARVNPGVNRGYQKGTLRADGRLAKFTGACGPLIYRGDLLPAEYYGAAFLCEPTANFVRCNFLREENGIITATNAFPEGEFLASTDERFRPVNLQNGPDGALYVVDMYRGVIQHRIYLTTYLRAQALSRGLEAPVDLGRIYRVVRTDAKEAKRGPNLAKLEGLELVEQLKARNGWVRDTAQQLLVERNDFQTFEPLNTLAAQGEYPGAMHALWVLNALGEMTVEAVTSALRSPHAKVRATAVRISEPFLRAEEENELTPRVLALQKDADPAVQLQLTLSLGESRAPEAQQILTELLDRHSGRALMRDAAVSGLAGREASVLTTLTKQSEWTRRTAGREAVVRALAESIAQSRAAGPIAELLDHAADVRQDWQRNAILDGILTLAPRGRTKESPPPRPVRLGSKPAALETLTISPQRRNALEELLVWPGKPGWHEPVVTPLTAQETESFEAGRALYPLICGACHQPNGQGLEGLAPPLAEVDWVTGSPERLVRIVLNGVRGRMTVKDKVWEMEMPPLNVLADEDIANLLTYIRREWGHTAAPVPAEFVAKVRSETRERDSAWTEEELLKLK
jgi:mono/diheme cytochrome c family protein/glucose/arabinose dehydrogenase